MDLELPRCHYGVGLEPQVKKSNNICRLKLLELQRKKIKLKYEEVMKNHMFSHIMVIEENGMKFSARLVHSFLCRELMTSKKHDKWFPFTRRTLRFSLQEYHIVTSLKVKQEKNNGLVKWKDDIGFWSKMIKPYWKINLKMIKERYLEESSMWTLVDGVRLVYLCVIVGVVLGRDEKVNFYIFYMKLTMDLEKLWKYLKVSKTFTGLRCDNWTECAKCSYEDIIEKDERVERILDIIQRKHDWSNHVWGVVETTSSEMDEGEEEKREEGEEGEERKEGRDESKTEIGESSHVAENATGTSSDSGRNKRKNADRRAESRKKKQLCQLAASMKGNFDTNMKKFIESLVQASFTTFEEKFSHQFSDKMDKFETVVTDRLGKIETEVT
ncbi:hypothetical protein N665_1614s0003 [Sinapis alba]|nr:hypothetical protein N665_1614s0003 [Sinapis alba]